MGVQVRLDDSDIERVIQFCNRVKVSPQRFGQRDSTFRGTDIMFRDMLVGKCGEVAFQKFLYQTFGIKSSIDWRIYEREMGDTQDILLAGLFRFEVKSIKRGEWFLIETDTLSRRKKDGTLPHYYVLVKVPYNESAHRPMNVCTVMGYCSLDTLVSPSHLLAKGQELPKKKVPLEAENYGVHCTQLNENWSLLLYQLMDIQHTVLNMTAPLFS